MDWDEEDELLYGGASPAPTASTSNLKQEQPASTVVNPPLSLTENGTAALVKGEDGDDMDEGGQSDAEVAPHSNKQEDVEEAQDDDEDDGEEDMDDAESDDSLEIVMDINPNAPPQAHEYARRSGAVPVRIPPPSQVQQVQQQAQAQSRQPSVSLGSAANVKPETGSPAASLPNPFLTVPRPAVSRPTGQPIPTRSRTPPPNLSSKDATYTPSAPLGENGEPPLDFKPIPQPIIDVDLESIEDKRWRRPGAHLSDYFNYGFDEATWIEWCDRQKRMRDDRERERENPFHVFADRPLQEAWQALPMELKGLMMQTIMTSFSGGQPGVGGPQMHPGMQGMMGPGGMQGMGGGNGMMQGMGGMNSMGMMQNNMGMMQGGGGGNPSNPGMMGPGGNQFQGMMGNGMGMNSMQQQQRGMGMPGVGMNMANMHSNSMHHAASPFTNRNEDDAVEPDDEQDDNEQAGKDSRSNYDDEELDPSERPSSTPSEVSSMVPQKRAAAPTGPSGGNNLSIPLNRGGMRGGGVPGGRGGFPMQQRGRGGFSAGRGGLVPQQQAPRAVSPLPDNLPKGPKSMMVATPPTGPASSRR